MRYYLGCPGQAFEHVSLCSVWHTLYADLIAHVRVQTAFDVAILKEKFVMSDIVWPHHLVHVPRWILPKTLQSHVAAPRFSAPFGGFVACAQKEFEIKERPNVLHVSGEEEESVYNADSAVLPAGAGL